MSDKICLVFGATGFVGSYVARELVKKGYTVRGTCRDVEKGKWLQEVCGGGDKLSLHSVTFDSKGTDKSALATLGKDCCGVFMCAGYETQAPETIDVMTHMAMSALIAAKGSGRETAVVLCSSTGSTNPPNPPSPLKNELTHWSDPEVQKSNNRWSPAAKTLMEINALTTVGRNQQNEVVDQAKADDWKSVRLSIMNPSLILGPQLQPGSQIFGNGLPWFAKICKGEAMSEQIPNDSMSIISVEDLALLHIAAMEQSTASGRYFGVNQSWAWEDILTEIKSQLGNAYVMPPKKYETLNPVTKFDNTRRDSLGLELKDLKGIIVETLGYLKKQQVI